MAATRRSTAAAALAAGALAATGLAATRAFAVSQGGLRGARRGGASSAGAAVPQAVATGAATASGAAATAAAAAAVPIAAVAAAAATLAAGRRARGGCRRGQAARTRGGLVVAKDGSSWGSTGIEASSSVDTSGPLPFVKLTRGGDEAIVYLLGATVTSYKTAGTEWLAVRPDAKLDGSKPISGGLPFCFPQFGPGDIQQHGFARNLPWRLLEEPSENGACVLELTDNEETRAMWPHAFRLEYRVELLEGRLATTFKVQNTSASDFNFQAALHSYYGVRNIDDCKIRGSFEGATKIDKTQDPPKMTKGGSDSFEIKKFTEEIYKEVLPGSVVIEDPSKGELAIESGGGWRDVVVWSPYGDENMGASGFVCVESAELASVPLPPNGIWEATMDLVPKDLVPKTTG